MPRGTYEPTEEDKVPVAHSHAFDKAFDRALDSEKENADLSPGPYEVKYMVTLKYVENPGWVVDRYDVELT